MSFHGMSSSSMSFRRRLPERIIARCCAIGKPRSPLPPDIDKEKIRIMTVAEKPSSSRFPKITEQGLDDLRKRIGVPITDTVEPWNYEATRDGIRHYAHGIGDDNPLWCDQGYAEGTHYGSIVALPTFLFSTSRIVSGYCGGLPGVHAMWAGAN